MMPSIRPLAALRDACVTFGGTPLFSGITFGIGRGERVCLVGANGAGKSTILRVLAGQTELDGGERFLQPGTRIGYLAQNPSIPHGHSVAQALARHAELDEGHHRIDAMVHRFDLDPAAMVENLSGGEQRRLALARALIEEPDILLLDEPTNHLDLPNITKLEELVLEFAGGVLMISHDRAFLDRLSNRVLWLDRGRLFELEAGFSKFEEWSSELMGREAEERRRLKKRIEAEEYWLTRGVTARRSRNEGRRRRLLALRDEKAKSLKSRDKTRFQLTTAESGGQLVIEAKDITKTFPGPDGAPLAIVRKFSTRIRRGDRVGIIGPNGAGKTTLVNLLIGEIAPDSGQVRLGVDIQMIRLDQKREIFDLDKTLWQTLAPGGGDSIIANGRQRHIVAYLRDFLFDERQASLPVRTLSGGERARLMLAKLFARPGNLVVLDEPTNDLDLETLDLLEDVLGEFEGTLILVSHDRDFLDRLVGSIVAVEGNGEVAEYAGGYSDYLRQRPKTSTKKPQSVSRSPASRSTDRAAKTSITASSPQRLTFDETREFEELPARIEAINADIVTLEQALGDPDLYERDRVKFEKVGSLLSRRRGELHVAEERWLELAARQQ